MPGDGEVRDVDWSELERRQPALVGLGRRRLLDPGVVLVATIRADGTPRVSPVEPFVLDGALWLQPCSSVHCVGMRYPIDVALVGRHGGVHGCPLLARTHKSPKRIPS